MSYNMTELKRKAREKHIDEEGRSERRNILATIILDVLKIESFEPWEEKYREDDYEEAWQHTSKKRCVMMKHTPSGGYEVFSVTPESDGKADVQEFGFSQKKQAESELISQLEKRS